MAGIAAKPTKITPPTLIIPGTRIQAMAEAAKTRTFGFAADSRTEAAVRHGYLLALEEITSP